MSVIFDDIMRRFSVFLNASWSAVAGIAASLGRVEHDDFLSDWLQANWELLVEAPFRESVGFRDEYLESYGEGADCNDASSRVWKPGALPTYRVVCRASEGPSVRDLLTSRPVDTTESPVEFDHFANRSERGWHEQEPPFDCILGYHDNQEVLLRIEQVVFQVERIVDPSHD